MNWEAKLGTLHCFGPFLFAAQTGPTGRFSRAQNLNHIQADRAVLDGRKVGADAPGRRRDQVLFGHFSQDEGIAIFSDQVHRGEEGQHHVHGAFFEREGLADGALVGRMGVQPGKKIQVTERRCQQVRRVKPITIAVNGCGVGCRGPEQSCTVITPRF